MSKATVKAFSPQKKHPALFVGPFFPSWIRIRIENPDPDTDSGTPLNPDPIRIRIRTYLSITGAEDREGRVEERPARPRGQALEHVMQHHVCQSAAKFPKSCYLKDKHCAAYIGIGGMKIEDEPRH